MKHLNHAILSLLINQLLMSSSSSFANALTPLRMQLAQTRLKSPWRTAEYVFESGYFILMCRHIAQAWDFCAQGRERVNSVRIPVYDSCEESDEECRSGNDEKEVECRQDVLAYYAQMYEAERVHRTFRDLTK